MRDVLTVRNRAIEALIASLPDDLADKEKARKFAVSLVNSLGRWEMKRRMKKRGGRNG